MARLELSPSQILCFRPERRFARRAASGRDEITSPGCVGWAARLLAEGRSALDPRAGRASIARSTVGPRLSDYVVAAKDVAVFSLGRLYVDARRRDRIR